MEDRPSLEPKVIWRNHGVVIIGLGVGAALLAYLAIRVAVGIPTEPISATLLAGVCGLGAVFFAREAVIRIRERRQGLPTIRLDQNGIECAKGFASWRDVELFTSETSGDYGERTILVVRLLPGASWEATTTQYTKHLTSERKKPGRAAEVRIHLDSESETQELIDSAHALGL